MFTFAILDIYNDKCIKFLKTMSIMGCVTAPMGLRLGIYFVICGVLNKEMMLEAMMRELVGTADSEAGRLSHQRKNNPRNLRIDVVDVGILGGAVEHSSSAWLRR